MTRLLTGACALAVGMALCGGAFAMTKEEHKAGNARITDEYRFAAKACKSYSGNAKEICLKEAGGQATTARAELKSEYQPSIKNSYNASVAKAQAAYVVAKERCDDKAGNDKDVCVKEAKSASVAAKADAKARMKISDARGTAAKETSEARKDASSDKRDADYAVAKQKCDVFAGDAKASCLNDAKLAFAK